jgi:hypothetical protein
MSVIASVETVTVLPVNASVSLPIEHNVVGAGASGATLPLRQPTKPTTHVNATATLVRIRCMAHPPSCTRSASQFPPNLQRRED